jgi:hypothetical protein
MMDGREESRAVKEVRAVKIGSSIYAAYFVRTVLYLHRCHY